VIHPSAAARIGAEARDAGVHTHAAVGSKLAVSPRRFAHLLVAALVLNCAIFAAAAAAPRVTFACSCDPASREDIGRFKGEPGVVVFIGTVRSVSPPADKGVRYLAELEVELVFKGDIPSSLMPAVGSAGGDCRLPLEPGLDMIAAALFDGTRITPALCLPFADPDSDRGQAFIAAAEEAYGPGVPPPEAPATDTAPPSADGGGDDPASRMFLASALGIAFGLVGSLVVLSRRRPSSG